MWLSDTSVKKPVFASVLNLLIIAFGIVAFLMLPLREYPDSESSVISISTYYPGASPQVIERKITQVIEDNIAGIEGIKHISSSSSQGVSNVSIAFNSDRDVDAAANDVRERVSNVLSLLPKDVKHPSIYKANANQQPILWLSLTAPNYSMMELTDYAKRYLRDRFATLDGVVDVYIGGSQEKAMKIWLDSQKLAARNLTVLDVERALVSQNIELPAGTVNSKNKSFSVRVKPNFQTVDDFKALVLAGGDNSYLVKLGEVAEVEIAPENERSLLKSHGQALIGLGIVKQTTANTLAVARRVKEMMVEVKSNLPKQFELDVAYDTSTFIERSIDEVYKTLAIAILLVVSVIYAFLGSLRAMLIPLFTVPISLTGTFLILYAFGFSLNLITLLAMVLAIGLVVDDTIVVVENIHRRVESGESKLVAAFKGAKQVGFAVIATTVVLVFVFIPITFLEGRLGQIFTEFAVAITSAVIFSSIVALSLSPMLASKVLNQEAQSNRFVQIIDSAFERLKHYYVVMLNKALNRPLLSVLVIAVITVIGGVMTQKVSSEFIPQEDRGAFIFWIQGPEGATYDYMLDYANQIEARLQPYVDSGEFHNLLIGLPGSMGKTETYNNGIGIVILSDWQSGRKPMSYYMGEVYQKTSDIPGVHVFPIAWHPLQGNDGRPVQFVIGGDNYETLSEWRDTLEAEVKNNVNIQGVQTDYEETQPQIGVLIDNDRANTLGVSILAINQTLESLLASKQVTTFIDDGYEYDVVLESQKRLKRTPEDIKQIYVRSETTNELISLANLVTLVDYADASQLKRYNRLRSITLEAGLAADYPLGEALTYLENTVKEKLPAGVSVDYKGASYEYKNANKSIYMIFALAFLVVFLVLAALFESYIHPFIIMLTVPLAITGALVGLYFTGQTLNIYSQIGCIILIGLAAKNGILIVEFINQLREEGALFREAIVEAAAKRLRPIIMTGITTAMGALPLVISYGAGSETRFVIGVVILSGVVVSIALTLFVIPVLYQMLAKHTHEELSPAKQLAEELQGMQSDKLEMDSKRNVS